MITPNDIKMFELQSKINDLISEAYEKGADADQLASMVFATGDAFGLLYGDKWHTDRIEIFKHEVEMFENDREDENNLYF